MSIPTGPPVPPSVAIVGVVLGALMLTGVIYFLACNGKREDNANGCGIANPLPKSSPQSLSPSDTIVYVVEKIKFYEAPHRPPRLLEDHSGSKYASNKMSNLMKVQVRETKEDEYCEEIIFPRGLEAVYIFEPYSSVRQVDQSYRSTNSIIRHLKNESRFSEMSDTSETSIYSGSESSYQFGTVNVREKEAII